MNTLIVVLVVVMLVLLMLTLAVRIVRQHERGVVFQLRRGGPSEVPVEEPGERALVPGGIVGGWVVVGNHHLMCDTTRSYLGSSR